MKRRRKKSKLPLKNLSFPRENQKTPSTSALPRKINQPIFKTRFLLFESEKISCSQGKNQLKLTFLAPLTSTADCVCPHSESPRPTWLLLYCTEYFTILFFFFSFFANICAQLFAIVIVNQHFYNLCLPFVWQLVKA